MDFQEWENRVSILDRKYNHFDLWISYKKVKKYITDPKNIKVHGFYPLIHFEIPKPKWKRERGKASINFDKKRHIFYASHIDSWIYRYYAYIFNEHYNQYLDNKQLNEVAVAYRNNLKQNNIDFANKAFSFIRHLQQDNNDLYVIIGDFTDFFDNLDHMYLKTNLKVVLNKERLGDDEFAVFKNVTRASYVELVDIIKWHKLKLNNKTRRLINKKTFNGGRILDINCLGKNKVEIHSDKVDKGVAQGTPISAVLSNIYMIKFDERLSILADDNGGFYQRYSDDFIFIFPSSSCSIEMILSELKACVDAVHGLTFKDEKRQIFKVSSEKIENITSEYSKEINLDNHKSCLINYLGFSYDGQSVSVRGKTLSRYFSKMAISAHAISRKTEAMNSIDSEYKKIIPLYKVFNRFTYKGTKWYRRKYKNSKHKKHIQLIENKNGNFHDYINNAQKVFSQDENISLVTKKSAYYLRKFLNKKYKNDISKT
jgi:hypothetical protein